MHLLAALLHDERGVVATFLSENGVELREAEQRALATAARISPGAAETGPQSTLVGQPQSALEKIGKDLTAAGAGWKNWGMHRPRRGDSANCADVEP